MNRIKALFHAFFVVICFFQLTLTAPAYAGPEGRSNFYCGTGFSKGEKRACGGHLEPSCNSGAACDAGINTYSGSPFPKKINCPSPIPDQTVSRGCYDSRPNCGDCSAAGQVPCPEESAAFCSVGCDAGLISNPTTTICEAPGTPGSPCGPGFPCSPGLSCDPTTFQCKRAAMANESCLNPFVGCADGLACTTGLCSHTPALQGESCSVFNPCAGGLFCGEEFGIVKRCMKRRVVGEACSVFRPCANGLSCEVCLVEGCNASLQCFPDESEGVISEQQCRTLYSAGVHNFAKSLGGALTISAGNEAALLIGESQEFGVAYGADGSYGCLSSLCAGVNVDASIEHFASVGFYNEYKAVGGSSWVNFQEASLPGDVLNFSTAQIYGRNSGEILPDGTFIGTADAFSIGISPDVLIPFSAGTFLCETVLDTYDISPAQSDLNITPISSIGADNSDNPDIDTQKQFGALKFDGVDDRLILTNTNQLNPSASLTLEAWISPIESDQDLSILSKEGQYQIGLIDGEIGYSIANTSPGWLWTKTGYHPPLGTWTHIALVYGEFAGIMEQHVYVNAQLIHRIAASGEIVDYHPDETEFHIGGRQRTDSVFAGYIDEVRIWSVPRTEQQLKSGLTDSPDTNEPGLLANWRFQTNSTTSLLDSGPNNLNFDLSLTDDATHPAKSFEDRSINGVALLFDGDNDHVTLLSENASALNLKQSFTLEAWAYPSGPGGGDGGVIVSKEGEYSLGRATDGQITFAISNDSPGWVTTKTQTQLPAGQWNHIALVYDAIGETISLYLNAELTETYEGSGNINDVIVIENDFRIGGRQRDDDDSTNQQFEGALDEIRIWSTARSAEEIKRWYDITVATPTTQLVGYWQFDENRVDLAYDQSGNRHTIILGSGRDWEAPSRIDATALLDYPLSLKRCDSGDSENCNNTPAGGNNESQGGSSGGGSAAWLILILLPLMRRGGVHN